MIQFHETVQGQKFFGATLPKLVKAIERIADSLDRITSEPHDTRPLSKPVITRSEAGEDEEKYEALIDCGDAGYIYYPTNIRDAREAWETFLQDCEKVATFDNFAVWKRVRSVTVRIRDETNNLIGSYIPKGV